MFGGLFGGLSSHSNFSTSAAICAMGERGGNRNRVTGQECIFLVFLSAGIARSPTASVGRLFSPHCPEYFVEDRKHSLSFSGAGRLAVTRVSDASFSSYHDVAHPAVQVVCSTQNRVTRQSVWRPFLARDSEWNGPSVGIGFLCLQEQCRLSCA